MKRGRRRDSQNENVKRGYRKKCLVLDACVLMRADGEEEDVRLSGNNEQSMSVARVV